MATKAIETKRTFTVSPHIIYSLIQAQAGSLGKAGMECLMNSFDAGATQIDVKVTPTCLLVEDNGRGFQSREEIEACFEVFGFEHKVDNSKFSKFGIGRAQLWNFCSTLWRTNTYSMNVDIKNKGIDYDLKEGLPQHHGLTITGKFYEKLKPSDIMTFEREIEELARWMSIPVTVNGKLISKDPTKEKWTYETDDAWIRLKENGELTVYNLGVKVKNFPAYVVGSAGLVVTKPGVKLALNMARNDILQAQCGVWKRIKPFLQQKSDERIKRKSTKLSDEEMQNLISRVLCGEANWEDICERKVITDIQGKNHLMQKFFSSISESRPCTVAPKGVQKAERAHQLEYAFVLAPVTLTRFGVETPQELCAKLAEYFKKAKNYFSHYTVPERFADDYNGPCGAVNDFHQELAENDHKPEERALIRALKSSYGELLAALNNAGVIEGCYFWKNRRDISIGLSETAEGWTDGRTRIVLERKVAAQAKQGLPGIMKICAVMLHEQLHEGPDTATHEHDQEFFERFETVVRNYGVDYGKYCVKAYKSFLAALKDKDLKVIQKQLEHADLLEVDEALLDPESSELLAA